MNWRWETLASGMQADHPRGTHLHPQARTRLLGNLGENTGEIASLPRDRIALHWTEGVFVAADGLLGYQWQRDFTEWVPILQLTSACTLWTREKNISLDGYAFRAPIVWSSKVHPHEIPWWIEAVPRFDRFHRRKRREV